MLYIHNWLILKWFTTNTEFIHHKLINYKYFYSNLWQNVRFRCSAKAALDDIKEACWSHFQKKRLVHIVRLPYWSGGHAFRCLRIATTPSYPIFRLVESSSLPYLHVEAKQRPNNAAWCSRTRAPSSSQRTEEMRLSAMAGPGWYQRRRHLAGPHAPPKVLLSTPLSPKALWCPSNDRLRGRTSLRVLQSFSFDGEYSTRNSSFVYFGCLVHF